MLLLAVSVDCAVRRKRFLIFPVRFKESSNHVSIEKASIRWHSGFGKEPLKCRRASIRSQRVDKKFGAPFIEQMMLVNGPQSIRLLNGELLPAHGVGQADRFGLQR